MQLEVEWRNHMHTPYLDDTLIIAAEQGRAIHGHDCVDTGAGRVQQQSHTRQLYQHAPTSLHLARRQHANALVGAVLFPRRLASQITALQHAIGARRVQHCTGTPRQAVRHAGGTRATAWAMRHRYAQVPSALNWMERHASSWDGASWSSVLPACAYL